MTCLRPVVVAVAVAVLLSGCTTAIDGVPTAAPSAPGPTRVRLVLPDPPPLTPPARVRLLPEIVTPVNGATR